MHAKFRLDPSNRLATVHKRYRQTGQTDIQWTDSIGRTVLQAVVQKLSSSHFQCFLSRKVNPVLPSPPLFFLFSPFAFPSPFFSSFPFYYVSFHSTPFSFSSFPCSPSFPLFSSLSIFFFYIPFFILSFPASFSSPPFYSLSSLFLTPFLPFPFPPPIRMYQTSPYF